MGAPKRLGSADPMAVESFRAKLRAMADEVGRKALFVPAQVSEANFSRMLGRGKRPIDNPGIFTVKALADAGGITVGELLGEQPGERLMVRPEARRVLEALDDSDRYSFEELLRIIAEAIESGRRVDPGKPPVASGETVESGPAGPSQETQRLIETVKRMPYESKRRFFEELAAQDAFMALRIDRKE